MNELLRRLTRIRQVLRFRPFALDSPEGRALERERRMAWTALSSLGARLLSIGVQFFVVGLLIRSLGKTRYGVWATLLSTVGWFNIVQLGVAPSLLNVLSAEPDRNAESLVSTAYWLQLALAGFLALLVVPVFFWIPWGSVVNTDDPAIATEAGAAALVLLALFLFRLPLSITPTVYKAYQEGYIASGWTAVGSLFVLGGIAYIVQGTPALSDVAAAFHGWPVMALGFATILLLAHSRPHLRPRLSQVDRRTAKKLVRVGVHFAIAGIAGAILVGTDNIVIAQILGPEWVTPYAVTFLLTQVVITMVMLLLDASWPAWSEAAGRGDVRWLRSSYRNVFRLTAAALLFVGGFLLFVGQPVIEWWAGPEAVPSFGLLSALVLLSVVQGLFLCTGRLITALGAVHVTAGVGVANAVINLSVSIVLAHYMGVAGVALGTVIGYVASGWVLIPIARRELARVEGGARESHSE